jgi:hypothetical protein
VNQLMVRKRHGYGLTKVETSVGAGFHWFSAAKRGASILGLSDWVSKVNSGGPKSVLQ